MLLRNRGLALGDLPDVFVCAIVHQEHFELLKERMCCVVTLARAGEY